MANSNGSDDTRRSNTPSLTPSRTSSRTIPKAMIESMTANRSSPPEMFRGANGLDIEDSTNSQESIAPLLAGMERQESTASDNSSSRGTLKRPHNEVEEDSHGDRSDEPGDGLGEELEQIHEYEKEEKSKRIAARKRKAQKTGSPSDSTTKTTGAGNSPPQATTTNSGTPLGGEQEGNPVQEPVEDKPAEDKSAREDSAALPTKKDRETPASPSPSATKT